MNKKGVTLDNDTTPCEVCLKRPACGQKGLYRILNCYNKIDYCNAVADYIVNHKVPVVAAISIIQFLKMNPKYIEGVTLDRIIYHAQNSIVAQGRRK